MTTSRALAVLAFAFFIAVAFQTYRLVREHGDLEIARAGQQGPFQRALEIRRNTESLAGDTAALADKGNADAKRVVETMRREGIALHASHPSGRIAAPIPAH